MGTATGIPDVEGSASLADAGSTAVPERVARFRQAYRASRVGKWYDGRLHLLATSTLSGAVILACALALEAVQPLQWLVVPLTFLYANLAEYLGHRVPMHRPVKGLGAIHRRHALEHHRYFDATAMHFESRDDYKAVLFPFFLIAFFFVAFALPVGLLLAAWFSTNTALLFVLTGVAYFLSYEWLHFCYHLPPESRLGRLRLIRVLRRLHATHHRGDCMNKYNFNITWPIGDWLFGTLRRGG